MKRFYLSALVTAFSFIASNIYAQISITEVFPMKGDSGTSVFIGGQGLTDVSEVSFGGVPAASFTVYDDTTIVATVGAGASGDIVLTSPLGTALKPGFEFGPVPSITSFSPVAGGRNSSITIKGKNLSAVRAVTFGGFPAQSFTIVNDSVLTAVPGYGATGSIIAYSYYGKFEKIGFSFSDGPVITSFSPLSGEVGTTVIIKGRHFNPTASGNKVFFGAVAATVTAATDSILSVTVPPGATFAPIKVTTNTMTTYSVLRFSIQFEGTADSLNTAAALAMKIGIQTSGTVMRMCSGDLDGDGKPELVTLTRNTSNLSIYKNISTIDSIAFEPPIDIPIANHADLTIEDLDNDNRPDIILSYFNNKSKGVTVYLNASVNGSINFVWGFSYPMVQPPRQIAINDIDQNGRIDIAIESARDSLGILRVLNFTDGFTIESDLMRNGESRVTSVSTGGIPSSGLFLEDVNGDGKPDMCTASNTATADSLFVFLNESMPGMVQFGPRQHFSKGANGPATGASGDLDGDQIPDIVLANHTADNISVIRNEGNFVLGNPQLYATGQFPSNLAIGDIDGDGKPEIVTGDSLSNTISIFKNQSVPGAIALSGRVTLQAGTSPGSLCIGDLNGDGKAEIAAINFTRDSVIIFRNKIGEPQVIARLKTVDADSKKTNRSIASLKAGAPELLITLAPNPARNYVTLFHPALSHKGEIVISDMTGKMVRRINAAKRAHNTQISLHGLTPGAYTITWIDGWQKLNKVLIVQ